MLGLPIACWSLLCIAVKGRGGGNGTSIGVIWRQWPQKGECALRSLAEAERQSTLFIYDVSSYLIHVHNWRHFASCAIYFNYVNIDSVSLSTIDH